MPEDLPYTVRSLLRDELPLLVPLWESAGLYCRPLGRDSIEQLTIQWENNPDGFIGTFADGTLIGTVLVTDDGRRGWINRLAVHPRYQGGGLGAKLIRAAEGLLSQRGLLILTALVENENTVSRHLFSSSGYDLLPEVLYYRKLLDPDA